MANCNPPLTSYLLAAVAAIFSWSEIPLHIAWIGVAFAASSGIYSLAKMWCESPLLASVIAIFTPAFLVSSTTLMCDVPMLAFWIWSMVFFARAFETETRWQFALAGLLAGLAVLTKYSALMLVPLIAAMGVLRSRKAGWWLLAPIVSLAIVGIYEYLTARLYGHGLISAASRYANSHHLPFPGGATAKTIIGLTFAGGSLLPVFFLTPWLWRWQISALGGTAFLAGLIGIFSIYNPGLIHPWDDPAAWQNWGFRVEVALLIIAGTQLILIATVDVLQRRDTVSLTLFLWIVGVFVFAGVINWTVNARSFLPACPAAAILAVRRLDMMRRQTALPRALAFPISLAIFVALSLVIADYQTANATRATAEQIATKYSANGHQLWIEGHAGFQYYLQRFGGKPVDLERSTLEPGDVLAVCWSGGNTVALPPGSVGALDIPASQSKSWMDLSGRNQYGSAGFYLADFGPVPFVIGGWGPSFFTAQVLNKVQYHTRPDNERAVAQDGVLPEFQKLEWTVDPEPQPPDNPVAKKQLELAAQFQSAGKESDAAQSCRKALEADPNNAEALNDLAWILATARDPALRNAPEAVQLAAQAVKLTRCREPVVLGTLAAAFAGSGEFPNAVGTAQAARDLALLTGRHEVANSIARLMELYASGKTVGSQ